MSETTPTPHGTKLLYYIFCVASSLHGVFVLTGLLEPEWKPFYTWELVGFASALLGLGAWYITTPKQRDFLLIIPVCLCVTRWSLSWTYGDATEIYTSTISVLIYFPVLVGCGVIFFGTHIVTGLSLSVLLSLVALWGNQRPEIMASATSEWRISPSMIGAYLLYTLFFLTWRRHISTLQEVKERESSLTLTLQATTAHQLASRMSVASKISGEVAHEFNNLLNVISPLCTFLVADLKDTKSAQDVKDIQDAAERMRVLSQELLSLTQTSRVLKEESDLIRMVTKLQSDISLGNQPRLSHLRILSRVHRPELKVSGSESELLKMIELLHDHILSLKPTEEITLRLDSLGASQVVPPLEEVQRGEVTLISIGHLDEGYDTAQQARHVRPLILDYAQSEFGLSAAYAIALRAGGTIRVEVTEQDRVVFTVYLPTVYQQADSITLNNAESRELHHQLVHLGVRSPKGERHTDRGLTSPEESPDHAITTPPHILIVDDEPIVLKVIERGLTRDGLQVTSTTSSLEALEYLREDASRYDLLISDVRMPECSGPEMIQIALSEGIQLPIYVYITGHIDDQAASSFKVSPERVLFKPFTPQTLLARVHQLLKSR